jgi:5'(3')-deoxyribonucleotidase
MQAPRPKDRIDPQAFVLGVDLDGVCADFYGRMRVIAAEWFGVPVAGLPTEVSFPLTEWGVGPGEYRKLHRFAVTQHELFRSMHAIPGAGPALRRLSRRGVRIRIITHRLVVEHFHQSAVAQTVEWLDRNGIPYWDLCFMGVKGAVDADLYIDDSPENITALRSEQCDVIAFTNSTNRYLDLPVSARAGDWVEAEQLVLQRLSSAATISHQASAI